MLVAHVSLWCRWSIIGVRKWCSFHIRPPRGCRAHALPGPIETSCCCWFFSLEHLSAAPAAFSTHTERRHSLPVYFRSMPFFFWHISALREGFLLDSDHCLYLGIALGWRRNVFQIGLFFFILFFFCLYLVAKVDWVLYKRAVSFRSSILHGNEVSLNYVFTLLGRA